MRYEDLRRLKCVTCEQEKTILYFFNIPSLYKGNRECIACNPGTKANKGLGLTQEEIEEENYSLRKKTLRGIINT